MRREYAALAANAKRMRKDVYLNNPIQNIIDNPGKTWTKEQIAELLKQPRAVERGIVAIFNKQTEDEKTADETKHHNKRGFTGSDARRGSYYAKWILSGRHLTGGHEVKARKMLTKYIGQLTKIANKEMNPARNPGMDWHVNELNRAKEQQRSLGPTRKNDDERAFWLGQEASSKRSINELHRLKSISNPTRFHRHKKQGIGLIGLAGVGLLVWWLLKKVE